MLHRIVVRIKYIEYLEQCPDICYHDYNHVGIFLKVGELFYLLLFSAYYYPLHIENINKSL